MKNVNPGRVSSTCVLLLVALASVIATGCLDMDGGTNTGAADTAPSGTTTSPGGTIAPPSSTPTPNAAGVITAFDPTNALVTGYAYDANNPQTSFEVQLFLNGPSGTGTNLGTFNANVQHNILPVGPYGFSYSVPAMYQDGVMRQIYAYAVEPQNGTLKALGNSPLGFWAGVNQTGENYYNSTVLPAVNSNCTACHSAQSYINFKELLASPDKYSGGSATNNTLINTALGGNNHGGGNRCGTASGTPCAQFQAWWNAEFN